MQAAYQAIAAAGGEMDSVDASKFRVLNMLNTKYFILPAGQQGQTVPVLNPYANGNAWFVKNVQYVNNANEEIDALKTILLTSYEPTHLVYETENAGDGIAVFSEIYYPHGWQVTIDGKPAGLGRADYVLRALYIPAGKHTVEMRFDPKSLHVTEGIAYGALALLVIGIAAVALIARKKAQE